MDLDLKGKVALISGGSRGIGRAVAEAFAAEGASVAIAARTEKHLEEAAADLRAKYGVKVLPVAADLSRPEEVERFVSTALAQFDRIDILVNVAGNAPAGRLNELSDAQWAASFELKFMGAVRASRAVLPIMRRQRHGCIISIAGGAGWEPTPSSLTLGAVNAALLNFTKGLSREAAAEGVRVNAVVPGPTETERFQGLLAHLAAEKGITLEEARAARSAEIPDKRPASPAEVGAAVVFLASRQAAHINGVFLGVNGGAPHGVH